MSLLIKALKKAELRHQEASALAIEQVSADPTFQAAESAAASASRTTKETSVATRAPSLEEKAALELQPSLAATPLTMEAEAAPPSSLVELEAKYMNLAQAHADTPTLTGKVEPRLDPQLTMLEAVVTSQPEVSGPQISRAQNDQLPERQLPKAQAQASGLAPLADSSNRAEAGSASRVEKPKASSSVGAEVLGKATRRPWPTWVKLSGMTFVGVMAAGAYLAWQVWAPIQNTPKTVEQASPASPAQPGDSQVQSAEVVNPTKLEAQISDARAIPTKRENDPPRQPQGTVKPEPRTSDLKNSKSESKTAQLDSLIAKVGPSLNLKGSTGTVNPGSRLAEVETASQSGGKTETTTQARPALATTPAATLAATSTALSAAGTTTVAPSAAGIATVATMPAKPGPRLLRGDTGERVTQLLEQAFAAVGKQDRRSARQLYEQVLELDRTNTDAMIALATLSAREGDNHTAERIYARILELDPSDSAARSGLASLRVTADPTGQESKLRHLLASQPAQPSLQFALGNSLAAQGRWIEAQQAYFQAFSADGQHPDYAFNLAISLERLHQGHLALNYYRSAQELSKTRSARFDQEQLRNRILVLERRVMPQAAVSTPIDLPPAKD